jgi:hypothetical protein
MLQERQFETADDVFTTIIELTGMIEKRVWRGFFSIGRKDSENISVPVESFIW